MEKNIVFKRIILTVTLIVVALVSIFGISKVASSTKFHTKSIQALDEKKITVMELTVATTITATTLASMAGDATTPLANQILELSSYLLIITGIIFLEKILLTLTGYVTFTFLVPMACFLFGIYLFVPKDILRNLAIKFTIFGLAIFMVVPVSIKVSSLIEATYQETINQTIEEANNIKDTTKEDKSDETENGGILSGFISKAEDVISNIGDNVSKLVDKGKKVLSNFIDAIAILLITSCVIPVVVLLFFVWIIKIIFGISVPVPNLKKIKHNSRTKNQDNDKLIENSVLKD